MRRRWLLILGGVVALGVATVFALALLVPRAHFRFLDGHKPLAWDPTPPSTIRLDPKTDFVYSFRSDHATLVREAESEMTARGFRKDALDAPVMVSFSRGKPPNDEGIMILRDVRLTGVSEPELIRIGRYLFVGDQRSRSTRAG